MNVQHKVYRSSKIHSVTIIRQISKFLGECVKAEQTPLVIDDGTIPVKETTAYSDGVLTEYTLGMVCHRCGERVREHSDISGEKRYVCDACGPVLADVYTHQLYEVSEQGVANFIQKKFATRYVQPSEDSYRLGKIHGREAIFAPAPTEALFKAHKSNVLVITCGNELSQIPDNWSNNNCKVVSLAELFYTTGCQDEVCVSDVLNDIKPKARRLLAKNEKVHERRKPWVSFIVYLLKQPFNPRDFNKGRLRPKVIKAWFDKHYPKEKVGEWTYDRDIDDFNEYVEGRQRYDKTEVPIRKALEIAAQKDRTQQQRDRVANQLLNEFNRAENEGKKYKMDVKMRKVAWDDICNRVPIISAEEAVYNRLSGI